MVIFCSTIGMAATDSEDKYKIHPQNQLSKDIDKLSETLLIIDATADSQIKISLLNNLALSYARLGSIEKALTMLERSLLIADSLEDVSVQVTNKTSIAQYYAQIGANKQAINVLESATDIVKGNTDPSQQSQLLLDISLAYRAVGDHEEANTLLAQSQAVIAQANVDMPEFPFSATPLNVQLGLSGWLRSFKETKAVAGVDLNLYKQWPEQDIFVEATMFVNYDSSRSVNNYRPGALNFLFYRHHFNEKWSFITDFFGSTNQSLVSSSTNDEDLTIIAETFAGLGYNLWRGDSPGKFLDIQIGVGPRYQYDYIDFEQRRNEVNPAAALILWGRDLSIGNARLDLLFSFVPTLNGSTNYELVSNTELSVPLNEKWSFTNRLYFRYLNETIIETNPKSLFFFSTGLRYKF